MLKSLHTKWNRWSKPRPPLPVTKDGPREDIELSTYQAPSRHPRQTVVTQPDTSSSMQAAKRKKPVGMTLGEFARTPANLEMHKRHVSYYPDLSRNPRNRFSYTSGPEILNVPKSSPNLRDRFSYTSGPEILNVPHARNLHKTPSSSRSSFSSGSEIFDPAQTENLPPQDTSSSSVSLVSELPNLTLPEYTNLPSQLPKSEDLRPPIAPRDLLLPQNQSDPGEKRSRANPPAAPRRAKLRPLKPILTPLRTISEISTLHLSKTSSNASSYRPSHTFSRRAPPSGYHDAATITTTTTSTNSSVYETQPKNRRWKYFRSEPHKLSKAEEELKYWEENTTPTDEPYGMPFLIPQEQLSNNLSVMNRIKKEELRFEDACVGAGIFIHDMEEVNIQMYKLEEEYLRWARYFIYQEHFRNDNVRLTKDKQQVEALIKLKDLKRQVAHDTTATHFDFRKPLSRR
ncbi:hypothetical protein B7494_g2943 [Chlorociboria aeruginascens]|nr:hypothetical protein B7494_g2943 [Chlorociboria aeruginascens]